MEQIDVGIPCMRGFEEFLYICIYTMINTAKYPDRLHFYIGIDFNDQPLSQKVRLNRIKEIVPTADIEIIQTNYPRSSLSHGIVLNRVYQKFTSQFGMVLDSDIAFICPEWDGKLLHELNEKTLLIGSPYNDSRHYRGFPCAYFLFFNHMETKTLNIDFRPPNWNLPEPPPFVKVTPQICKKYNLPINATEIRLDTGSDWFEKFYNHKLSASCFTNRKEKKLGIQYNLHNVPMIVHHDNSTQGKHPINKIIKSWLTKLVPLYPKKYRAELMRILSPKWFE